MPRRHVGLRSDAQSLAGDPLNFRWEAVREQMAQFRAGCEDGDRRACVRLGVVIGENRERRAQWSREHPEMFSWERDRR